MAGFKHRPIDLDGPSLRLLRLLKDDTPDIHVELFSAWLFKDESPETKERQLGESEELFSAWAEHGIPYEALSYTWGSAEKTAQIFVNGAQMKVTENLWSALRDLRLRDEDRILWIDAICIDQDNHKERGHQVQQMGAIYRQAERVLIWMGYRTTGTDAAMDFVERLHARGSMQQGAAKLWDSDDIDSTAWDTRGQIINGLVELLRRPWFRRIWILQEAASARYATIVCGGKSVSTDAFTVALSFLNMSPRVQAVLDVMPGLARNTSWFAQKPKLRTLLEKFRDSEATQPQDKIFALLGISSDAYGNSLLQPDYTKTLEQTVRATIAFLLTPSAVDASHYDFIHWTFDDLMQNLKFLRLEVFKLAWKLRNSLAQEMLLEVGELELKFNVPESPPILTWAVNNDDVELVEILIQRKDVNLNLKNGAGETPLAHFTKKGYVDVVKSLLATNRVDLNLPDSERRSPIDIASYEGHEGIVKLLLENEKTKISSRDRVGKPTLFYAIEKRHESIVKLLLGYKKIEVDFEELHGYMALTQAASTGQDNIVKLLLETDKVDVNRRDESDDTSPLDCAVNNRCEGVVKLLLETDRYGFYDIDRALLLAPKDDSLIIPSILRAYSHKLERTAKRAGLQVSEAITWEMGRKDKKFEENMIANGKLRVTRSIKMRRRG